MMSLTFGLFTQVSGSGPLGPLVLRLDLLLEGYCYSGKITGCLEVVSHVELVKKKKKKKIGRCAYAYSVLEV